MRISMKLQRLAALASGQSEATAPAAARSVGCGRAPGPQPALCPRLPALAAAEGLGASESATRETLHGTRRHG